MKHLPAIDGLRAIAVLAVMLYHAGLGSAGFVGVDVFFVISGYLITGLLLRAQRDTGRIDLLAFYARRVRRIFPAAAVVVLATLGIASLLLAPSALQHAANSAGAALIFGANVFFQFTTGGYWDANAEEMPLLHLWSLSVEEQFYLLWPALLILLPKAKLRPALAGLTAASLAVYLALPAQAGFYQMPARFWELAAGGLIATLPARPLPRWVGSIGLGVTLTACVIPLGHFPGLAVLGAATLIAAIHGGVSNALLASRPMVGVGLISYSLYLWHWPLLALYRATSIGEGSQTVKLALCSVAMLLAVASYRYVEQPFRLMRLGSGRTVATGAALSLVLALSACAVGLQATSGQVPDNPAAVKAEHDMPTPRCHISSGDVIRGRDSAIKCPPLSRVLVWGDSMAWSWLPAVPNGADLSMDACAPFLGYLPHGKVVPGDFQCRDHNAAVVRLPADAVVLAARWHTYPHLGALAPTLDALRDVPRVVIVGPTPEMRDLVPRCIRQHAEAACTLSRSAFDAKAQPILAQLRALAAQHPNVEVLDVTDRFCTVAECPPVRDGIPLYWDSHHITATAARSVRLLP